MIEITDLTFGYKMKPELFRGTELSFVPGRIYGVLGKNGAGKTSLLKLISGLLKPKKGECLYDGVNITGRTPSLLSDFYLLPETSFLPPVRIKEFIEMYSVFYPAFSRNQFADYLEKFELAFDEKITSFSYGQRKKLSIAFAFASNTRVLLLDEPTNGLDIPAKSSFRKIISSAVTDDKIIIVSTHQVKDVKNIIDRIIILENGKVIFNHDVMDIESKLTIVQDRYQPTGDDIVYCENLLGGYFALAENKDDNPADIDFEFLFNAVIANSKKINQILYAGVENE